jgi:hypothetical protein
MDIQVVQKIDLVMRVTDIGLFLVGGLGAIPPYYYQDLVDRRV